MRKTCFAALAAAAILTSCSATHVALKYQPPAKVSPALAGTPPIMMGTFADVREYKPKWIGRLRGTFGNSLGTLVVDESVATLVQTEFRDGLLARQFTVVDANGVFEISGVIHKLSSIQYVHLETDVEIEVRLVRLSSGVQIFTHTYSVHSVEASHGYSLPALRAQTERALRDTVNQALDDPAFREALRPEAPVP